MQAAQNNNNNGVTDVPAVVAEVLRFICDAEKSVLEKEMALAHLSLVIARSNTGTLATDDALTQLVEALKSQMTRAELEGLRIPHLFLNVVDYAVLDRTLTNLKTAIEVLKQDPAARFVGQGAGSVRDSFRPAFIVAQDVPMDTESDETFKSFVVKGLSQGAKFAWQDAEKRPEEQALFNSAYPNKLEFNARAYYYSVWNNFTNKCPDEATPAERSKLFRGVFGAGFAALPVEQAMQFMQECIDFQRKDPAFKAFMNNSHSIAAVLVNVPQLNNLHSIAAVLVNAPQLEATKKRELFVDFFLNRQKQLPLEAGFEYLREMKKPESSPVRAIMTEGVGRSRFQFQGTTVAPAHDTIMGTFKQALGKRPWGPDHMRHSLNVSDYETEKTWYKVLMAPVRLVAWVGKGIAALCSTSSAGGQAGQGQGSISSAPTSASTSLANSRRTTQNDDASVVAVASGATTPMGSPKAVDATLAISMVASGAVASVRDHSKLRDISRLRREEAAEVKSTNTSTQAQLAFGQMALDSSPDARSHSAVLNRAA
jgi:hypothetical protein